MGSEDQVFTLEFTNSKGWFWKMKILGYGTGSMNIDKLYFFEGLRFNEDEEYTRYYLNIEDAIEAFKEFLKLKYAIVGSDK